MVRGLRNNNPLNIRRSKDQWLGMAPMQTDKSFVQFTSRIYGYRAGFRIIRTYLGKGVDTIGKIIKRWAPANENNTQAYIAFVSRSTGIDAGHVVRWEDRDDLVKIVRSMVQMECGIIEDTEIIRRAYELAG